MLRTGLFSTPCVPPSAILELEGYGLKVSIASDSKRLLGAGISQDVAAAVVYLQRPLRPEAILCLLVPLEFAELSDFLIHKPPYMHFWECRGAPVAFRLNGHERYHEIFFGKDVMNFDSEDTAAKFHGAFEKSDDLVAAIVSPDNGL